MNFEALFNEARAAGLAAGNGSSPEPMVVVGHSNPLDDSSPVAKRYFVSEGACGFAWVTIRPGNCPFANWLKKTGKGRKAYGGGVQYWVGDHGQSVDRKEAHASAFAKVISAAGITAYAGSRLD
jgi:hypothetical protein